MADVTNFKLRSNRIDFDLDDEHFAVKYPSEYNFGREYLNLAKEVPLCLWANKVAFEKPETAHIDFEVDSRSVDFWLWIAEKTHQLDVYQSLSDAFDSDEIPLVNIRNSIEVTTGQDPPTLVSPVAKPVSAPSGAIISQSPGKESVATKIICDHNDITPQYSVFIEYSSRAATHKISGREEYSEYFDNPSVRVWSNFNELQSTLQEYTENYEPITCFWEEFYLTAELPLAAYHNAKYILMGNQLNTGEAMHDPKGRFVAFEEINQSAVFEIAYTNYLSRVHDLPIVHTSNVRPFTGYSCRKLIAQEEPGWLQYMQNCLRPKPENRWCLRCYKCNNSWVEFLACGINPEEAGLSHDVLIENPHFAADTEDWGFSFPRYARDEQVWREEGAQAFFVENVHGTLNQEQLDAFYEWRELQKERVSREEFDHLDKFNGKFIDSVTGVVPDEVLWDGRFEHTNFVPELLDVRKYKNSSIQWMHNTLDGFSGNA